MKRTISLLLILVLLLTACGGAAEPTSSEAPREGAATGGEMAPEPAAPPAGVEAEESGGGSGADDAGRLNAQAAQADRKIIYTASMQLRVDDPRVMAQSLRGIATKFGGYVSQANVYEYTEDQYYATVELRVDAEQFDAALEALRGVATEVLQEQLDTQDVTDQFVDLTARIENLERTEEELQILLTEARENRGKTEDILAVYRELTSVREQIELYQGQLNVLSDSVDLATITVELVPPEAQIEIIEEGWSATRTARSALRTLTEGLQAIADLGINLVIVGLPMLLILALIWAGLRGALRWMRGSPKTPVAPPSTE